MSDDPWDGFEPNYYPPRQEQAYKPSSEVIPHWSEPKPTWEISDEEFWEAQVMGRLFAMHERHTRKKIVFERRHPNQECNFAPEFTQEQRAFAGSEVRKFRADGSLPKSFSDFRLGLARGQNMTYKEFRKANPK